MYFSYADRVRNPFAKSIPLPDASPPGASPPGKPSRRTTGTPRRASDGGCPLDATVPAVLVRVDRNPFHHGTLGAARSLGRAGVPVHAVSEGPRGPLARSRYVVRTWRQPPQETGPDGIAAVLADVAEDLTGRAVLVPLDDHSAVAVDHLPPALADRFLLPAQPRRLAARVADKARLAEVCAAAGIAHPETAHPTSPAEAAEAVRALGAPAIAKWSRPWLLPPGSGLRSTTLVRTPAEAAALHARTAEAGSPLLIQHLLPYAPGRDWFCHAYADRGGHLAAGGTGRKVRAWPPGAGLTAAGRWEHDPRIDDCARRLVAMLGYRGVLDLDFRYDATGTTPYLLDFNPRPGAQFRLFTDHGGLDVVRALHLDLTGRPLPARAPAPGRRFTVGTYALLSAVRGERVGPAGGTGAGRAGREGAWWAADDPLPAAAMTAAWSAHLLARAARRLTTRPPRAPGERPVPGERSAAGEGAVPEKRPAPEKRPVPVPPSPVGDADDDQQKASSTACTTS
ncbi:ATP-grasp domain-containing protein [Streptomyces sp. NRRL F-5630]|uniref:carboxylate--amine ligase n=1 Tax=Streptomyces sp. NRRL F-5630 TaxID=1463864 RepID=UPI003D765371